jgi:hypothetical protein
MRRTLSDLGEVAYLVAPGTFHHLHVSSAIFGAGSFSGSEDLSLSGH